MPVPDIMTTPVMDLPAAKERFGGNLDDLREILELFLEYAPGQLAELRAACDSGQVDEARHLAHRLQGAAGNVSAQALQSTARDLERAAREDVSSLTLWMQRLELQFDRLQREIAQLLA